MMIHINVQKTLYTAILLLFLSPVFLYSGGVEEQTGEDVIERSDFVRPRRMMFLFSAPESFSEFEKFYIYNSVFTEISGATPEVVILESEEDTVPPTFEGRQELIRRIDADSWVFVEVLGDPSNISFYHETFDVLNVRAFGEKTIETGLRLDFRALSRGDIWNDLVSAIQNNYSYLVDREDLTIAGLPDTVITELVLEEELVLDRTGSTTLSLQSPATYSYYAALDGYYPIREEFYLGFEDLTIDLVQRPSINFSLDFSMSNFQFLGFQFYWFPVPADVFIRVGFTTYALSLYLISNSPVLFRYNPLTVIKLHGGFYLFDKINLTRPYLALGAGIRIEHSLADEATNTPGRFGFDENTPVEVSLVLGVETSLPDRFLRFYAEYNPTMYISKDVKEFKAGSFFNYIFDGDERPGYVFAEQTFTFDFRNFNLGVRMSF